FAGDDRLHIVPDEVDVGGQHDVRLVGGDLGEIAEIAHLCIGKGDAELLHQFALETGERRFARLDLAAGLHVETGAGFSDQQGAAVIADDGGAGDFEGKHSCSVRSP